MDPLKSSNHQWFYRTPKSIENRPVNNQFLEEASEELACLYEGDLNAIVLGLYSEQDRDMLWRDLAEEYPGFADRILNLRKELKKVPVGSLEEYFGAVQDKVSRFLLGDLLWIRLGGFANSQDLQKSESSMMLRELGIPREKVELPVDIPVKLIVSEILNGRILFY